MNAISLTRNHRREGEMHVLLADDHRAASYRLWALLSGQRDVLDVSTGESMEEALGIASQRTPGLCVVSATFGAGEGLSLAHRLKHLPQAPLVLIYAEAVDARLAGAALIAGADGVFDSAVRAEELTTMLTRVAAGEQAFPALVPDPFDELAARVDEENRRIVAMLLLRANPDEIARVLGISARSFRARLRMIVRRLDAGYLADRAAPDVARRPGEVVDHGRQRRQYARAVSVPLTDVAINDNGASAEPMTRG